MRVHEHYEPLSNAAWRRPRVFQQPARFVRPFCLTLLILPPLLLAQPVYTVDAETWSRPRSAETLLQLPPLREAVAALQGHAGRRLSIHHPEGEQGELWASELRDWLVALGIPSARIDLQVDDAVMERLDLVVHP
jgi:hypothetical protein